MTKFDFQVSKSAREKYGIGESLFSVRGNLIVADFLQARIISDKINQGRKSEGITDQFVTPGEINALGLLHEVYHFLIRKYENDTNPGVFKRGIDHLKNELNENELEKIFKTFVDEFPPLKVYKGEITPEDFLKGSTEGKSNKEIILEELILLNIENKNPAAARLRELFSDDALTTKSKYTELILKSELFFEKEKPFGYGGLRLFSLLRKPIITNPYSIEAQLEFIRTEWSALIGDDFLNRLLRSVDLIREDYKLFIQHGGGEKATPPVPTYDAELERLRLIREKKEAGKKLSEKEKYFYLEYEKFTEDTHWIPEVVMIAKNMFVWLHQLSEKYGREIKRLDQVPDEELDQLARWNFNALWLIGIWERSPASVKIKHLTGNIGAAASAYSLYDYVIAGELGGEEAFQNLKDRAWLRGIRMASDMVPNHTGIFSKWVIEKPDYFIQSDVPPFPNYTFNGTNLSEDDRVEIRIEDKYYNRSDAAVVFQRRDKYTGDVKYIYHGNDGTNMPWNDTAQLNLLKAEVRESIIQTIMHVAHKTPIIRFDAAMTLSKKHYQRLWFPQPGSGGAIPSRSDYAMTLEQFDSLMPVEFWREVVDRINESMPNVLLLAEAFWLMEGYFVRTLGMHRVYNSAFMHMMMKEENEKYRQLIRNTLEFNPEILKRYVNFMSNPDEETAINQFGKGDKYFGVAVMMVTMPGLPMFGHGQIEGFAEKYGMEYKMAYYNETADEHLVWRHHKEIFPLMRMRHLFSQVEHFELYDFYNSNGEINQNVFAYSNKSGNETVLVLYNNSYYETEGSISYSCPRVSTGSNGNYKSPQKLADLLGFKHNPNYFYIYRDHRTALQYLVSGKEIAEEGFKVHLFGYQYRICLNFSEVYDVDGKYRQLYQQLNGKGVSSIEEALKEMDLIPLHSAIENFFTQEKLEKLLHYITYTQVKSKKIKVKSENEEELIVPNEIENGFESLISVINTYSDKEVNPEKAHKKFNAELKSARSFYQTFIKYNKRKNVANWMQKTNELLPVNTDVKFNQEFLSLIILLTLKRFDISNNFDELLLSKPIVSAFEKLSPDFVIYSRIELIKILLVYFNIAKKYHHSVKDEHDKKSEDKKNKNKEWETGTKRSGETGSESVFMALLDENIVHNFLRINEFEGITYFNKERFEELLKWLILVRLLELNLQTIKAAAAKMETKESGSTIKDYEKEILQSIKVTSGTFLKLIDNAESSGYDLNKFKQGIAPEHKAVISKKNKKKSPAAGQPATKGKSKKPNKNKKR